MKPVVVEETRGEVGQREISLPPECAPRGAASRFWLHGLFWLAGHAPWILRLLKRPVARAAVRCSGQIRAGTFANARRILGGDVSRSQCRAFARGVVGNFYDFVVDVGSCRNMSVEDLRGRIESIEGHEEYLATRRRGGGAIILTAHMGSFELGLAALSQFEQQIHVVFKRDAAGEFESIRRDLRQALGIHEAPIDEGWNTWAALRDALESNQVVVMQGDRAMAGQKAQAVAMFGAHLSVPIGPIKLAQITGSPIIPVFVIRTAAGRFRLFVLPAIFVDPLADLVDGVHPQILQWGAVLQQFITTYPRQWLLLEPAFVEDLQP